MSSGKFHDGLQGCSEMNASCEFAINTSLRRSALESRMSVLNDFDSNKLLSNFIFNMENCFQSTFWTPAQKFSQFLNCLTNV